MTLEAKATTAGEWEGSHKPVVVAVDGSTRNRNAVDWAAREAAALGCEVVLVTALPEHVLSAPRHPERSWDQQALDMLADVRAEVRHLVAEQTVETRAVTGTPVAVLLDAAEDARMIVVGKRGLGGFARVVVGSTSIALAGRAPVPVTIVPDPWQQARHAGAPIVLGVDPLKADHKPVHLAFRRAKRLGVPVVAVHGQETPAAFSWDSDPTGEATGYERAAASAFDELLANWATRYPEVVVRPMRARVHPASAILEAAESAQLVVLGRHDAGIFGGFAFGSVARAVLHYSTTPVITVPA